MATHHTGLKILVISMGVLFLGGVVLLVALTIHKFSPENRQKAEQAALSACASPVAALPVSGPIEIIGEEGNTLKILVRSSAREIHRFTLDPCTGKILRHLTIRTQQQ